MAVTLDEVKKIAELARLDFTEEEYIRFTGEMNRILEYMDKLNELDTAGVEPMAHPAGGVNFMREDELKPSLTPEEALKNAPAREDNFFSVPKVI
ncbi:MAG: Asp-tRNA(Asn)/Glu-tRNA(Gln) amidotransferase subunit GatC [Ignavibacteriales bacterium]|nr:Glutamyl-tRNA(Gln) amidotransferase subunit C [Ignavibacteriaceae bacterium]MCK6613389.1 Asp-tRNA(Asn)/Glu-tRNA(Gln) amidotransferase subunit GatC [Ignavibacteriaceae bacterium]QOJ28756.1 MAG: Asp-tRNA(Asn)/Glu-tRNA(Gln) amidotransferase subunit GatC [Ignavibacteriales bacterium]